jgi:hypothetical protein
MLLVGAMMAEFLLVTAGDSAYILALKQLGMAAALVGMAIAMSGAGNVAGLFWTPSRRVLKLPLTQTQRRASLQRPPCG